MKRKCVCLVLKLLFGAFLFSQNLSFGEGASGLFPFFDSIYQAGPAPEAIVKTEYQFSRFYASNQDYLFTLDTQSGFILALDVKTRRFIKVYQKPVSWFALSSDQLVTVSKEYQNNQGFQLTLFKINKSWGTLNLKEIRHVSLDLFLSDSAWIGNNLFLAGSDKEDISNRVVCINTRDLSCKTLTAELKDQDFLKMIYISNSLIIYGSISAYHDKKLDYTVLEGIDQPEHLIIRRCGIPFTNYNFFGKGFSTGSDRYYLPLITKKNQVTLAEVRLADKNILKKIPVETALYQGIEAPGMNRYFIGYNYFKDPGTFSWLTFNTAENKLYSKPLYQGKSK